MKRKIAAIIFLIGLGGAAYYFSQDRSQNLVAEPVAPKGVHSDAQYAAQVDSDSQAVQNPTQSTEAVSEDDNEMSPPDMKSLEEELAKNPDVTPQVLIEFAHSMSEPMDEALESQTAAEKFFPKLSSCARGEEKDRQLTAMRAICLVNAGELADKYPESFQGKYRELISSLPTEVVKLAKSL